MNDIEINSKEYWDMRFRTDWESNSGREQSRYFARLAVDHFPDWLIQIARAKQLTWCDWGCAEGDGTDVLAELLGGDRLCGIDFSAPAIEQAQRAYPHITFHVEDWLAQNEPRCLYDIVFSSNTLEHFHDPGATLRRVLLRARECVVLLLPYREFDRHPEHHHTFLSSNIKFAPTSEFVLAHSAVINTANDTPSYWGGLQILLVYARPQFLADIEIPLANVKIHDEAYAEALAAKARVASLEEVVAERNAQIESAMQTSVERDARLADLTQLLLERDSQIVDLNKRVVEGDGRVAAVEEAWKSSTEKVGVLQEEVARHIRQASDLRRTIDSNANELKELRQELDTIKRTRGWRYLTVLHKARGRLLPQNSLQYRCARTAYRGFRFLGRCAKNISGKNIGQFVRYTRNYGPAAAVRRTRAYLARAEGFHALEAARPSFNIRDHGRADELLAYLRGREYKGVFVMGSCCMGWHEVFKQRHHHIADYLMASGYLVLCAMNPVYPDDYTDCLKRDQENLFLVNFDDRSIWSQVIDLLAVESTAPLFYHLVGTEPGTTMQDIDALKRRGYTFVYDYLDEISKEINPALSDFCLDRHEALLRDEDILLVTSADNLYSKSAKYRSKNLICTPNGVRLEDWVLEENPPIPAEIESIVEEGKPIVGYYGSFAVWMNYDFIKALSRARPDVNIVMIGYDYDWGKGAFAQSRISELPNVHILPAQKYNNLKYFSRFFDAGIVPFREYELTKSVSPVKMFEYMAQGIPVVASGMEECRKYESCLNADDAEDFVRKVSLALELKRDADYIAKLRRDAEANTWTARGEVIEGAMCKMVAPRNGKLLSVVVPTYNMETLLPRCLDSMLPSSQLGRLEIIVVNDGSKDNSLDVARRYASRFPNTVRVIDKENGGHGSCINAGIREASGRYFKIVDADDWLEPLALTMHMHYLTQTDVDMVVTNYLRTFDDGSGQLVSYSDRLQEKCYKINELYDALMIDTSSLSYAHMHAITYRTDLLKQNGIKITEKSFYVDQEYISFPQPHIDSASFEDIVLYRYYIGRPGQSVAPDVARKRAPDNYKILMNLVALLESLPLRAASRAYILNIAFHHTWFYLTHSDDAKIKRDLMVWWRDQSPTLSQELNQNFRIL
ncbi:glycosyltransferase [Burkholderia multivorans]|uniref:glycosyltransferase n=1 Tax=Burkholderia multivorans TaxID=87883 RepID=UPI001C263AB9|nr:glycosyltransferase [Burkholderia multivorans]MBU9548144.1 glycosyltransferase [Burkholderia multivorans]